MAFSGRVPFHVFTLLALGCFDALAVVGFGARLERQGIRKKLGITPGNSKVSSATKGPIGQFAVSNLRSGRFSSADVAGLAARASAAEPTLKRLGKANASGTRQRKGKLQKHHKNTAMAQNRFLLSILPD